MEYPVIFIHGIGEQKPGYSKEFEERIKKEISKRRNNVEIHWFECYWADITQKDEDELKTRTGVKGKLRDFFISSLGDAVAYSKIPYPPDKYSEIQKRFKETILKVSEEFKNSQKIPLTLISHSLGTVIASDGMYDMIKHNEFPENLIFKNFITLGSPIALYSLRYGIDNFTKPVRPENWVNIYYPQDIIGFPLKNLNPAYKEVIKEDICLNPRGGVNFFKMIARTFVSALPLFNIKVHSYYFDDKRVIGKIADLILSF